MGEHDVQPAPGRRAPPAGTARPVVRGRVDSSDQAAPSVTRKPDRPASASQCARPRRPRPRRPLRPARRRPGSPCRPRASASSSARSGTTRWMARTRSPPGPIGVTRASTASLPVRVPGSLRGVRPGGGEPVVPVGDDRTGARRSAAVSRVEHGRVGHPPEPVPHAVGVGDLERGRRRAAPRAVSSATVGLRVVGQHDRLEVGGGGGQQRPAALDGRGEGVLVGQHGRRPGRRQRHRSQPPAVAGCRPARRSS